MNLRPLGIGEQLDAAFKVCVAHWRTLVKVVLFVVVPVQVLSVAVTASTIPDDTFANPFSFDTTAEPQFDGTDFGTFFAGQLVVGVLNGLMVLLAVGACFRAITQVWLGERPDWRESLRFALRRSPALLWVSLLYLLAVMVGFMLLVVPGIWLAVAFALCFPVVLVERVGGAGALRRSFRLVRERWWPTFAVLLVGYLLATILSGIAQAVFSVPVLVATDAALPNLVLSTIGGTLGYVITTPFTAAVVALAYFDLRVRKEGLDLELVAERLGAQRPEGAAPAAATGSAAPAEQPAESSWSRPGAPGDRQPPPGWQPPASGR